MTLSIYSQTIVNSNSEISDLNDWRDYTQTVHDDCQGVLEEEKLRLLVRRLYTFWPFQPSFALAALPSSHPIGPLVGSWDRFGSPQNEVEGRVERQ